MAKKSKATKRDADDSSDEKKGSSGLMIPLLAGGGLVLLLCLCGGGGLGAYFVWGKRSSTDPVTDAGTTKKAGKKRDIVVVHNQPHYVDLANDPKWLTNPDLNKLFPARWRSLGTFYDVRADGTMERISAFPDKGTYKITGPESVDITRKPKTNLPTAAETTISYIVLVNDDEMAIFTRSKFKDAKPNEYTMEGPFFRMRDDGTGLGRTQFIDPLIQKVKSGAPAERANALGTLGLLGPDAWPAVPEMVRLLDAKHPDVGMVFGTLSKIGPKAKAAVPSLRKYLNDKQHVRSAITVLGEIGPDAKDALPDLRRMLPNDAAEGAIRRIDPKAKF